MVDDLTPITEARCGDLLVQSFHQQLCPTKLKADEMMLDFPMLSPSAHYAVTPHTTSLLLDEFTVKLPCWRFLSQQIPDLLHGQFWTWIRNANPVVVELSR